MADPFSGATTSGGAANQPAATGATAGNQWLTDISSAFGVAGGLEQGGAKGYTQAATSAAKLASGGGAFGTASGTVGSLAADATNLGNIIQGIQRGGVTGYSGAAVNAAALYGNVSKQLTSVGAESLPGATEVSQVAAPLASAYSIYNFAKNYRSGATGQDALRGAEMGATIGSEFGGPVGAAIGAAAGAAFGAVSSIFGPGQEDPENIGWNEYAQAYSKGGTAGVQGASPSQNYQMLAGIFDSRGSNIPFYNKFGRMGEGQFMQGMTGQINQALASGKIAQNATPQQIYSQVVEPWINSMSPNGWQNTSTIQGAPEKQAVGNLLTSMIGQWQQGQLNSTSHLGIAGQELTGLQTYGAQGYNAQAQQQQQSMTQQVTQQLQQLVAQFPMGAWGAQARM